MNSVQNKWSEEETKKLNELIAKGYGIDELCSKFPYRSEGSVTQKYWKQRLVVLGKSREPYAYWSDEDVKTLRDMAAAGCSVDDIAAAVKRSGNSVRQRISREGIKLSCPGRAVTDDEIEELREEWEEGVFSIDCLAMRHNRSRGAIAQIAYRNGFGPRPADSQYLTVPDIVEYLGISRDKVYAFIHNGLKHKKCRSGSFKYLISQDDLLDFLKKHPDRYDASKVSPYLFVSEPDWFRQKRISDKKICSEKSHAVYSDADDKKLINMRVKGYSLADIAKELGRSECAIKTRLNRMDDVPYIRNKRFYSDDDIAFLRENADMMLLDDMAAKLHRSPKAVAAKCESLGIKYHMSEKRLVKKCDDSNL